MADKCETAPKTPAKVEPELVEQKIVVEPKCDDKGRRPSAKEQRHSPSSKDNYYIKKRILSAIKRSFRSSNKSLQAGADGVDDDGDEKHPHHESSSSSSKNHQSSVTIIVKRIDLDEQSILYTREKGAVPDVIDLETFKVKEVPSAVPAATTATPAKSDASEHRNSNHVSSSDRKRSSGGGGGGGGDNHAHRRAQPEKRPSDSQHHQHASEKKRSDESSSSHRSSSGKKPHISDETLKGPYLLCHSCGRKYEKKWLHPECKNKCCRSTAIYCDSCLRHKIIKNDHYNRMVRDLSFGKYMYVVKCPSGRGCSLHMDYERIVHLRGAEQKELAREFLKQAFKEDDKGFAQYTIAIVHNGARYMPDMLKLLAQTYPTLKVNTTKLKSSTETEFSDLLTYYKKVKETYNCGTFSHNPLNETQAACVKNADEYGGYLPEMLSLLEQSSFLAPVLPWGEMTTKKFKTPHESDDGPIFWCRPGEQIISLDRNSQRNRWNSNEIESFLQERKKNMNVSEKKLIVEELKKYRRSNSAREYLFEDRTRPHADQAWGNSFEATAAVGVIKAIHPDEHPDYNRICKEIIVFQAKHLEILEALLHIDTTAAPKQQCAEWLDDAKLNMIRQMKIEFSKLHLRDNDIYFIPRKIVHQFKTVSATLSIAWHTRLREYYKGTKNEAAVPAMLETPQNCAAALTTPKKKNRSRSTSLEQGGSSAKKRKLDSIHRSRSTGKKLNDEQSVWRENGHKKASNLAASLAAVDEQKAAAPKSAIAVKPKTEPGAEAEPEPCGCTTSQATPGSPPERPPAAPPLPAGGAAAVKEEPGDDRVVDSLSDDPTNGTTPSVQIGDVRPHLSQDEPGSPSTTATQQPSAYPVVNNGNTVAHCVVDAGLKECAAPAAKPAAVQTAVGDTSHPAADGRPVTPARGPSPPKQ